MLHNFMFLGKSFSLRAEQDGHTFTIKAPDTLISTSLAETQYIAGELIAHIFVADSKMAVSQWSPDFVQEILPVAEKTSLLYNLSYLCLANFPNLKGLISGRAVETQLLFESSDGLMLKCVSTSKDLVEVLFPKLAEAVETNKGTLAIKCLRDAKDWIKDVITEVDRIVEKYGSHNRVVASSTSDVITEKQELDQMIQEQTEELKVIEQKLADLNSILQETTKELEQTEEKIYRKRQEIQEFVNSISQTSTGLDIFSAVVPFLGLIIKSIYDAVNDPKNVAHLRALEAELNSFITEISTLKEKQWQINNDITDNQMKADKVRFDLKFIPDPIYLKEVLSSLTKIQAIQIEMKNFWEKVAQMLDYLEQKTFIGEEFIDDFPEIKDQFLDSIETAKEAWSSFGEGCNKASVIFKLQTKDAYKFLEVDPSSLSQEEWQKEYESVKERLKTIDPLHCVRFSVTPAISE